MNIPNDTDQLALSPGWKEGSDDHDQVTEGQVGMGSLEG